MKRQRNIYGSWTAVAHKKIVTNYCFEGKPTGSPKKKMEKFQAGRKGLVRAVQRGTVETAAVRQREDGKGSKKRS